MAHHNTVENHHRVKDAVRSNIRYLSRIGFVQSASGKRANGIAEGTIRRQHR